MTYKVLFLVPVVFVVAFPVVAGEVIIDGEKINYEEPPAVDEAVDMKASGLCASHHPKLMLISGPRKRTNVVNDSVEIICTFLDDGLLGFGTYAAANVNCPPDYVIANVGYAVLSGGPSDDRTLLQRSTKMVASIPIILSDGISQAQTALIKTEKEGLAGVTVFARCAPT